MKPIDFIPISELKGLQFSVEAYQRGYKWESKQIGALLKDIHNHHEGKYCLQPVIVKSGDTIELIDGQQRLTSIFMLLYFLTGEFYYGLSYKTRKETERILSKVEKEFKILHESIQKKESWNDFIDHNGEFDNVDIFHLYLVYSEIFDCFKGYSEEEKDHFRKKLENVVHIIWYDVSGEDNSSSEQIFLNLNAGKVPLTNSELIKALFVLSSDKRDKIGISKIELANDWDKIEIELQNDEFWYFISDHAYYNKIDTRIDFLFDIVNGNHPSNKGWFEKKTYLAYEEKYINQKDLNWEQVKQTYNKLVEWYNDKTLYHYIGFLIVTKIKSIRDILRLSKAKSKDAFKSALKKAIQHELVQKDKQGDGKYDLEKINYEDNRKECEFILLLFNMMKFLNNTSNNKFPFDLYRKENWSVEHITPQNPREFKDVGSFIKWLSSFKKYFDSQEEAENDTLVSQLNEVLDSYSGHEEKQLITKVKLESNELVMRDEVVEKITSSLDLHSISNLALLDRNTNSALGNLTFIEKREKLLKIYYSNVDKDDVYIPENTKDVFTKAYTSNNESITDEIFGIKDMEDYKTHLKLILKEFYKDE